MVDVVLKMTLGLFVKKARSSLSEKLKDGGLNSQQLRGLIMSNLQDIKTKLAGLARSNLLTSASNLQEGLRLLDALSLDKPNTPTLPLQEDDKKVVENPDVAGKLEQASTSGKDSHLDIDVAPELTEALKKIKINSSDNFVSAMKLFENANTKATEAFHNEALSLEDRVLATKVRVLSRLLLSLENPSLANQPCRLYLEELHDLSFIVEMFYNEFEGGMSSLLNKEKRRELVLSVSVINFVVFEFLKKFTIDPISLYDWPTLKRGMYNPLIPDKTICIELQNSGFKIPGFFVLEDIDRDIRKHPIVTVAENSDGHLFLGTTLSAVVNLQTLAMNELKITELSHFNSFQSMDLFFVAIDSYDNVYVLTDDKCSSSRSLSLLPRPCTLFAYNSKEVETDRFELGFCRSNEAFAPTPDGFVLVSYDASTSASEVAFYRNDGGKLQRTSSFHSKMWERFLITVTKKYQVVVVEKHGFRVRVYEKDGRVIREFELYGGKDESCVSIAFNYLTEEVVFVTFDGSWYFLSTYLIESGERRFSTRLTLFGKMKPEHAPWVWNEGAPHLTSHYAGHMALVSEEYILYIQ